MLQRPVSTVALKGQTQTDSREGLCVDSRFEDEERFIQLVVTKLSALEL